MLNNKFIGSQVKKARQEKGITQSALAEAINISQPAIAQIETGNWGDKPGAGTRGGMYLSTMYSIAKYFGKEISWFVEGKVIHLMKKEKSLSAVLKFWNKQL